MPEPDYNTSAVSSAPTSSPRPQSRPSGLGSRSGRNMDADMYAGSSYAPTSNAGTASATQTFSSSATSTGSFTGAASNKSDDGPGYGQSYNPAATLYSNTATALTSAGATLTPPKQSSYNPMNLYSTQSMAEISTEIKDYLRGTAIDDALREALGIPEVYQGAQSEEEPDPNITDPDVLRDALQPEPITVEELPDVIVEAGDTLTAIAEANNVPVQDVIDANPQIANPDMIRPGQKVNIPSSLLTKQEMLDVNKPLGDTKVVAANVDFDFIKDREGYKKKMYVPKSAGKVLGKSGPTIASGFDLGQRNEADLKGLPPALVKKLKPYLGKKGSVADAYVRNNPLTLTTKEVDQINKFAKKQEINRLKDDWEAASNVAFEDLTKEQATVVASVAFQYGDLPSKAPTFWKHVTNDDWDKAEAELRNFGDKYTTRRTAEADYLAGN